MTIKKNGGIFGRNPTFNNVNIDGDLTVAGAQTFQSDQVIKKASPTLTLFDTNDGVGLNQVVGKVEFYGSDGSSGGPNNRATIEVVSENSVGNAYSLVFKTSVSNGVPTEVARFTASKNLAFQSGQGIDFSATAGTGTSELLDDYEEGTWTPVYTADTTDFTSVTYDVVLGEYVKIGDIVFISMTLRTDAISGGSGVVRVTGLPFTPNQIHAITIGDANDFNTNPTRGFITSNSSSIALKTQTTFNGDSTAMLVSDMGTGANDNLLRLSGFYIIA